MICAICQADGATATTQALNGLPIGVLACEVCRQAVRDREVGVVRRADGSLHITDGRARAHAAVTPIASQESDMPDTTQVAERFARLPIDQVIPSKTNPRTHFDEAYLDELAASIADKGVVQPILVRQVDAGSHKPMKFEVIAGECRYRASKRAKQSDIPAVIRQYTDLQVLELQLVENIHRRDLSPLEQARGYRQLIDSNPTKHSAESIAQRIGMSPQWVWDRLKLNDLIPEAKTILDLGLMTVGHAILIARLKPADQERVIAVDNGRNVYHSQREGLWQFQGGKLALDEGKKPGKYDDLKAVSVRELEDWIRDHVRFDVQHAAKAQPLVFEETAAQVAAAAAAPGRGKKVIPITHSYRVADDARDGAERTYGSESWKRADGQAKSKTCDHSVLGLVVAGDHQGDSLRVCVARDKCLVHFGDVVRAKQKAEKLRASGKTRQAAKTETRAETKEESTWARQEREREARRKAWDVVKPEACRLIREHLADVKFNAHMVELVMDAGELASMRQFEEEFGFKITPKTAALVLALATINTWDDEMFIKTAKPWKFEGASVKTLMTAQLKPCGATTSKKTTKAKSA